MEMHKSEIPNREICFEIGRCHMYVKVKSWGQTRLCYPCLAYLSLVMRKPTMCFPNRSDTNRAVQAQKMARVWKFWIHVRRTGIVLFVKTKALISFAVTAKLICFFVLAHSKCWFSHDVSYLFSDDHKIFDMTNHEEI